MCSTFFLETAPRFLSEELPPFLTANVLQVARPRHSDSQVQGPKVSCAFHARLLPVGQGCRVSQLKPLEKKETLPLKRLGRSP